MALGATLKVKMDTSAVSRGLSGMKSKVGRAFGAIKKVGLAAFGAIAAAAAGLTAAAVSATNFVRSVEMMGIQTGMTTKEVLDLQHAFALVRIDADGAADVMSEFQKRLAEARMGQGEAIIGLNKLNISLSSLKGLSTMEAFERILSAVTDEALDTGDALMAMDKMFGSKGFELRRLAMDYKNIMASARQETEGLSAQFADTSKFKSFEESMARGAILAREIQMRLVNALPLEKIGEVLDRIDLDKFFESLTTEFEEFMKAPEAKFVEWGSKVGIAMGEGIAKGITEYFTSKEGLKSLIGPHPVMKGVMKALRGTGEVETEGAKTEGPVERRERKSKMRFNTELWNKWFGHMRWGKDKQEGGKTTSLDKDLLQEAKRSNVLLSALEGGVPSYV